MKKINIEEQRKILLNLLINIDEVCKIENIEYSLAGGTLLGAVRHGGFIPWDDDIDILMTRPNYNKFITVCSKYVDKFNMICYENNLNYPNLFLKVYNPNTILMDRVIKNPDNSIGISVDVFPIDSLGNSLKDSKKLFRNSEVARRLLDSYNWKRFTTSKTRSVYVEVIRYLFFLCSRFISPNKLIKKIESNYSDIPFGESKYSACYCGTYGYREIMLTTIFENYTFIQFEDNAFMCILKYDEYLQALFDDYMVLPPKSKQYTHHTFEAYYR